MPPDLSSYLIPVDPSLDPEFVEICRRTPNTVILGLVNRLDWQATEIERLKNAS